MALRLFLLWAILAGPATPGLAQDSVTVRTQDSWFYNQPDGARIARMERGTRMVLGATRGDWQEVTLEGWIFRPSVAPTAAPGYDLEVTQAPNENLRVRPNQRILSRLERGFLLDQISTTRNWVQVRRVGWMRRSALDLPATGAPQVAIQGGPTAASLSSTVRVTPLRVGPNGDTTATVNAGRPVRIVEREGAWVRVVVDGWIPAEDVAEPDVFVNVTLDALGEDPELYIGKTLRWTVQVIGVRTADELRPDIPLGRRYMLARGPLPAGSYVYVTVPDEHLEMVEGLQPLTTVDIDARVVAAHSRYLGNPVLELVRIEVRATP